MRARRGVAFVMAVVLAGTVAQAVVGPLASAADGPSVKLPDTKSTPVSQQPMVGREQDQASRDAMEGDQKARSPKEGGGVTSATSLSPSATWDVSQHTGDFSWSYPLRVPPAPGGLEPNLSLSYRSSEVDGRTSATNNQPSWIGDGWALWPGFVERGYVGCVDDVEGDAKPQTGDLCWRSDNATASYGGNGGALIRNGNGDWRAKNDDGARIEHLTGAANGGTDGEYWKITTVDGTQYFFGSQADSRATWTVPVFGDDANEPCHGATFESSQCVRPWRWNLDKVVDRNGNMIRYFYDTESGTYGMNMKDTPVSYIRGGTLTRIDYGLRDGDPRVAASGRVVFTPADRCVPGSDCRPEKKDNWQDVPWDEQCAATCKDHHSPTFWSTKRLDTITTEVRKDNDYKPVDRWRLEQAFPDPGDGEKAALWLRSITHTGLVGGEKPLPAVTFEGTKFGNRIVAPDDGLAPLNRYRITGVVSESGGVTSVSYTSECRNDNKPSTPDSNTMRCFPVRWAKKDYAERTDYFHKYVVSSVVQSDRMSSSTEQVTRYEYLDGAAWHWDTSEFVKEDKKSWNEFRGFGRVRVRTGTADDPAGPRTMTEQRFYQGMDGDKVPKTPGEMPPTGTRPRSVSDTAGGVRTDSDWLSGFGFESDTFEREGPSDQPDPPRVTKTITDPSVQGPTATRGTYQAYIVRAGTQRGFIALAAGGWQTTQTDTTYDDRGLATKVNDLGDTTTADDDRCTTTTYDRKLDKWLLALAAHVETVSVNCDQKAEFPRDALADAKNTFDANGNPKQMEVADSRPATGAVYATTGTADYDAHGRATVTTDAMGNTTRMAYTPAVGGPVTQKVETSSATTAVPEGLIGTTTLEPAWGAPSRISDPNGRVTEISYDPLGRTTNVWLPNRPKADNPEPNFTYTYEINNDKPSVVTTTTVGPNGNFVSANTLYDGLSRPRQVQASAFGGGRLLTDTRYDSHGRVWKTSQPYFNDAAVDKALWVAADTELPGHTRTQFDGAGREVASVYYAGANAQWQATTEYSGDRIHVTPPTGATTTTTVSNARGQAVELRQYTTAARSESFDTTKYTYTKAGQLETVTDESGASWRYTYDLRGRQLTAQDPDSGTTSKTYDNAGRVSTMTNAAGSTIAFDYDALGRKTGTYRDRVGGTKLAEWTFDTVDNGKGKPATSTRWVGTDAYTSRVLSYDPMYQATGTSLTIPASQGLLAGTYNTYAGYDPDGSLSGETLPAAGELPAEEINYTYHDLGMLATSSGGYDGNTVDLVTDTKYTRYGEVARVQFGPNTKRMWLTYLYDTNNRRPNRYIVDAEVPEPMQADLHYTQDPAGNITSIADTPQAQPDNIDVQCFKHDHLRRVTDAWTPAASTWSAATGCSQAPAVNGLSGPARYWHSYTFDKAGNRLTETQHATGGDTTREYTYNVPGHTHALASVTTRKRGVADTRDSFAYEATGNTKTRTVAGASQTFDWDAEGHLASVTEGGKETSFVYDAGGSRLIRKDPDGTTLYLGNQELHVNTAGGNATVTRYYTYGGKPIAMRQGTGKLTWLATDHQATAQIAVNSDTMQVTRRRQYPFGAERGAVAASAPRRWPGERGFLGGTNDASTGLTHLGAREYDPATGRFISVDPVMNVSDPQQMNGYAYSNNNPSTLSDPSGAMPNLCPDGDCKGKGNDFYNRPLPPDNGTAPGNSNPGSGPAKKRCADCRRITDPDFRVYKVISRPITAKPKAAASAGCQVSESALYDNVALCDGPPPTPEQRHAALDVCGMVPVFGELCDALNGIIYLAEGDLLNAGISGLGLVPWGGQAATGARLTGKIAKNACSFTGDTQVVMADGTTKPIAEIKMGDVVLAADPDTGEQGPRAVTDVWVHDDTVLDLATEDGSTVTTTKNHRFYNATDKEWQDAGDLDPGDKLATADGSVVSVAGLRVGTQRRAAAYNLTVQKPHTYYVRTRNASHDLLVHNHCRFGIEFEHTTKNTVVMVENNPGISAAIDAESGFLRLWKIPSAKRIEKANLPAEAQADLLAVGLQARGVRSGDRIIVSDLVDGDATTAHASGQPASSSTAGQAVSDALGKLNLKAARMDWKPMSINNSLHIEVLVG